MTIRRVRVLAGHGWKRSIGRADFWLIARAALKSAVCAGAVAGVRAIVARPATASLARAGRTTGAAADNGRHPDLLVLADPDIFLQLLEPRITTWHALVARNRIVLAYTARSRGASEIDSSNWFRVLEQPGVEVGRADPNPRVGS